MDASVPWLETYRSVDTFVYSFPEAIYVGDFANTLPFTIVQYEMESIQEIYIIAETTRNVLFT